MLVVALACVLLLIDKPGAAGYPVAAERIDPLPPLPVIQTPPDRLPVPGTAPLADPAIGDTAVAAVLADLQDYWTEQDAIDPVPGQPAFRPPRGGYVSADSTDPADGTALCITDAADLVGNAYYCQGDDGIVFDSATLVPVLLGSYGSAALVAAIAHEFGHAVQDRLGPPAPDGRPAPTILVEAQADCAAGAFLAWVAAGNAARSRIPADSLLRAVSPTADFRDAVDLPPDDPSAHGLGLDRITFLLTGFHGGLPACRELRRDTLPLTLGRPGVDTQSQSATIAPRFALGTEAERAGAASVAAFAAGLSGVPGIDPNRLAPTDADRHAAASHGQFAAAAAVALAAGRSVSGPDGGEPRAACFTGAWTASVFGTGGTDGLGNWAGDADEALDLIRTRPGATFADVEGFVAGFHGGWPACQPAG